MHRKVLIVVLFVAIQCCYCFVNKYILLHSISSPISSLLPSTNNPPISIHCRNKVVLMSSTNDNVNDDEPNDTVEDALGGPVGPLPSVSSRINFGSKKIDIVYDLWVAGAGILGSLAALEWKKEYPNSKIIAETRSNSKHDMFQSNGIIPRLRSERSSKDEFKCKNVLIAFPPSTSGDYIDEINEACRLWAGPEGGGSMVVTSSSAVYGESIGNVCNEKFRVDTRSSRSLKMICAEEAVLSRDGSVIRLAGLYNELRGPHTYWIKNGTVDAAADGTINMLHYNDAASATISVLKNGGLNTVYLACDNLPVTRREICNAAIESGLFPTSKVPVFTSEAGPVGKILDCSWSKEQLQWKPKYESFPDYMIRVIGKKDYQPVKSIMQKKLESKSSLWIPGGDDMDDMEML